MSDPREPELELDAAIAAVLAERERLTAPTCERVPIERAGGRVLGQALRSRWALPGAPLSIMDGYAVRSGDLQLARAEGGETLALELIGESAAGHPSELALEPGTCQRISTGAVLPTGADAVVPQEDTRRIELEGGRVFIELSAIALAQSAPGRWVRAPGSDVRADELLLERGSLLGPGELALLAATGHAELPVLRRPRVAVLQSGDELVAIASTPARGQIVATNGLMLVEQIREAGGEPLDLGRIEDRPASLRAALLRACEQADLLVASGGISVGDHDLLLPALRELGLELVFRRVKLRPGRPTTFGLLPRGDRSPLPVLALPGNPASTAVAFELFARPLLRAWLGLPRTRWFRPCFTLELAAPVEGDRKREHLVRVRLDERGRAHPLAQQLSGALRSLVEVDALVRIPAGCERAEAGERYPALLLRA